MGNPVREALKRIKPDILLLAEDDGTGGGTEVIYADRTSGGVSGGVDAAYDFKLYFYQIRSFAGTPGALNALHAEIDNGGFFPGEHALYMRFMESQDEDRIVYFYSGVFQIDAQTTFRKTMPLASVLFTAPGLPMLWNGQEVGWGYGITGAKEARARSVINWEYQGRDLLAPHYQKLATLRGQFPAFTAPKLDTDLNGSVDGGDVPVFVRIPSSNDIVYAFSRPYPGQNGLTVVNVTGEEQATLLNVSTPTALLFNDEVKPTSTVYLNDLFNEKTTSTTPRDLGSFSVVLAPYESRVYTVSVTQDTLKLLGPITDVRSAQELPARFVVHPNYPNPFNPSTVVSFEVPAAAEVAVVVYDILGREVVRLFDGLCAAGFHRVVWDTRATPGLSASSGVYYVRVTAAAGGSVVSESRSMLLIK